MRYTGWNAASYLAGEIERPRQQLPRAILLGTGVVVVLYLALNTAYALTLSAADVRKIADVPGQHAETGRRHPDRRAGGKPALRTARGVTRCRWPSG